jgi:signal peptidase II
MKIQELLDKKPKCTFCKIIILLIFIIILTGSDLLVKEIAYQNLKNKPDVVVIQGFWSYHYVINDDIGFSVLRWLNKYLDSNQKWIFLVLLQSLGSIIIIIFYFFSKTFKLLVPLALITCGALGNVIDRIIRGYVVDYVMWYYKGLIWPIFNLADIFTVTGAILLFIILIFFTKEEQKINKNVD